MISSTRYLYIVILLFCFDAIPNLSFGQTENKTQINWLSMEQPIEANKVTKKKLFFDVYTDWCGWCKRMDATTFQNSEIIRYLNENYYAVKFDAESTEEITVNGKTYGTSEPGKPRQPHQFAVEMLRGRMSYPSFAVYDETLKNIGIIPGFQTSKDLEVILHYFGTNANLNMSWEDYKKEFKGKIQLSKNEFRLV